MSLKQTGPTYTTVDRTVRTTTSAGGDTTTHETRNGSMTYRETNGAPCPDYWYRKNRGRIIPMMPFTQLDVSWNMTGSRTDRITNNTTGAWTQAYYNNHVPSATPTPTDLKALAHAHDGVINLNYVVNKAAANIASRGWDALTFASEVHKTRAMFVQIAGKLISLRKRWFQYLRGKEKLSISELDQLFNLWLEGRYGWRTLLYDLEDLHGMVTHLGKAKDRQRGKSETGITIPVTSITDTTSSYIRIHTETTEEWVISWNGRVVADFKSEPLQINPFVTGWELVPFSFVIDWFVSVGNAIQVNTLLAYAEEYTASGGISIQYNKVRNLTYTPISNYTPGSTWTVSGSDVENVTVESLARVPMTLSNLPQFKVRLDALKIVDLIALARQLTRGRWR